EATGVGGGVRGPGSPGPTPRLGGVGSDVLAAEAARRHARAFPPRGTAPAHRRLDTGGEYQWRREGEPHLFSPETVFKLQHATRTRQYEIFKEYTQMVDDSSARLMTLRGLLRVGGVDGPAGTGRVPIGVEGVEPAEAIVRRFSTGAMSYGSISAEAHETLAIAMNRLGGKSNTGEGGEDPERFLP